ncbi:bifunctional 4-hydroxy-2-oxoglutarate aldolase/2-dehydro-3-deoxy-phosphogluconate aldolase [Pedobacter psychroterrae]|uniref:Bifunctional 4-hydroxy-2-oxoglutarate aldolase/2-dehydro-3-deoxy-phosphogluconate aldolase n=1 Tax=Pedobacter psychroterrae TaxID=2530453 RepID=A0A4R0NL79_9SPHI|nr:bifunctional 4-hydroxy-2-oxoglutarate aldolase/2-dehydro-3-deoxy-phosphogluconate aldolase [Pedobacter psychroterrae]TCD00064.1 bifunctional 4-hydroxy-2-oxoglutarate aldolase/2-dehydro-3-deoxy-phosphogluconate aldolase [Pedobacter psychroterrae]
MSAISQILEHKIIAIIRGADPADVLKIAEALYAGGIRLLEITMNSAEPLQVIREVAAHFGDRMTIGAGTVLDVETLRKAVDSGARFILSPVMDIEVIGAGRDLGVVSIPGAYTATEIFTAYRNGADIVKVFPARSPAYLKDIAGPLPQIPLMPTGGVSLENIADFHKAGAVGFGIGSALVDTKKKITEQYLAALTDKAAAFVQAVHYSDQNNIGRTD